MKLVPHETYTATINAEIMEEVDVLVAGGGTAGAVAAIAAARGGAKVLLVERQHFLGGMVTGGNAGLTIYTVYDKRQAKFREITSRLAVSPDEVQIAGGIPMEITRRLLEINAAVGTSGTAGSYVFTSQEDYKHLLLTMMQESGVEMLLHSLVVDVVRDGNELKGVVLENKSGRQVYPAKVVVDATGDGDVAARADVPFVLGVGPDDPSARGGQAPGTMSNMGVMFRMANIDLEPLFIHLLEHREQYAVQRVALMSLDEAYENFKKGDMCCFGVNTGGTYHQIYNSPLPGVVTLCCPSFTGSGIDVNALTTGEIELFKNVRDRVAALRQTLPGFTQGFLLDMPEIGVRETRHIQGDYVLTIDDILTQKAFPDSIGRGAHPIDVGPLPKDLASASTVDHWYFNIPYGALIACGIDNLLLAGRCISATHEAFGCTRPTVQCMIIGQAAGTASALCAIEGLGTRQLDIPTLRRRLTADGVVL